jgi:hypothetical protein
MSQHRNSNWKVMVGSLLLGAAVVGLAKPAAAQVPVIGFRTYTPVPLFARPPATRVPGLYPLGWASGYTPFVAVPYAPYGGLVTSFAGHTHYVPDPYVVAEVQRQTALRQALEQAWISAYEQGRQDEEEKQLGRVSLDIEPRDARLYLNGKLLGTAASFARRGADLRLPAGSYQLEIQARGHIPLGMGLEVKPGEIIRVDEELERMSSAKP